MNTLQMRSGKDFITHTTNFSWTSSDNLALSGTVWFPVSGKPAKAPPLLCLSGLSRNRRDFTDLAEALQKQDFQVIALDYRGRGASQWDEDWQNYSIEVEGRDIDAAITKLNLSSFFLLGSSRGGLHAMALAQRYTPSQLRGIILNDIGPEIEASSLERLAKTIGVKMHYDSLEGYAETLKASLAEQFTNMTAEDWIKLALQLGHKTQKGFTLDYDPALGNTLKPANDSDVLTPVPDLWPLFDSLSKFPLLLLRGEHSDLLSQSTFEKMQAHIPEAEAIAIQEEGHTPLLWDENSQSIIQTFLQKHMS